MDNEILERINPIYKNEQEYLKHLAAVGIEGALKLYGSLKFSGLPADPSKVTPSLSSLSDASEASSFTLEKCLEIADEARFLMTNEMIRGYEATNVIEIPCGYTPRGLILANEGYKYVGLDLPVVISDIGPAVRALSENYSHRAIYKSMDATNFGSMTHALENVNGELTIVSEIMLSYLTDTELISVCDNIYKLLSSKGGCFITMDIGCRDLYKKAISSVFTDKGEASYESLISHFKNTSDMDLYNNVLYAEGARGAEDFLSFRGFDIEKVSVTEVFPQLASVKNEPEIYERFRDNCSDMEYWTLTVNKRHGTRIIKTQTKGCSIDKKTGNGFLYLNISGRLDTISAPDLLKIYEEACADESLEKITIDCKNLEYISSAGLRVFLIMLKNLKNRSGMTVRNVSDTVMEILEATGFTDMIDNITHV